MKKVLCVFLFISASLSLEAAEPSFSELKKELLESQRKQVLLKQEIAELEKKLVQKPRNPLFELKGVTDSAQRAINSSTSTMEQTRIFYESMTNTLLWAAGILAAFVGAGGLASVYFTAKSTATKVAEKKVKEFSSEMNAHLENSGKFHEDMGKFKEETLLNLKGFLILTTELNKFTNWVIRYGWEQESARPPVKRVVNPIFRVCKEVLALKPTNEVLLGIVFGTQGIALHLEGKFDSAYENFKKSLEYVNDRPGTLYNIACAACRLRRFDEAKSYLRRAIAIDPEEGAVAKSDHDFDAIREDEEFINIVWDALKT